VETARPPDLTNPWEQVDRLPRLRRALYGPLPPCLPPQLRPIFLEWGLVEGGDSKLLGAIKGMVLAIPQHFWEDGLQPPIPTTPNDTVGYLGRSNRLDIVASGEAVGHIMGRLGWGGYTLLDTTVTGARGRIYHPLTVKAATTLQLTEHFQEQRTARAAYVASALSASRNEPGGGAVTAHNAISPGAALKGLTTGMKAIWRLPWDNVHKEPLWRLTINGVRHAGGHGLCPSHPCPCGFTAPTTSLSTEEQSFAWRLHHFWHCPIAQAVVEEIRRALPLGTDISCAHLWLLRHPGGVSHDGVWGVVATAALAAMHSGRKYLISLHLNSRLPTVPGQALITSYFAPTSPAPTSPPTALLRASQWVKGRFWCLLEDFAFVNATIPTAWGAGPPTDHPFLATTAPTHGTPRLMVHTPR
jgi:hypothetical protein